MILESIGVGVSLTCDKKKHSTTLLRWHRLRRNESELPLKMSSLLKVCISCW